MRSSRWSMQAQPHRPPTRSAPHVFRQRHCIMMLFVRNSFPRPTITAIEIIYRSLVCISHLTVLCRSIDSRDRLATSLLYLMSMHVYFIHVKAVSR
ncbi:hypothetical protein BU16DRAFT_226189 [Lophium mytilinum]|uniref:Uncharacterized protein n=1 Tax=Lophium mytilinum TaxID=390894 RepID=A0A6A6Q7N9_9PEZI|nr:hypothetical protein BU16DRAFT_226189 [Lophium mytilinum]